MIMLPALAHAGGTGLIIAPFVQSAYDGLLSPEALSAEEIEALKFLQLRLSFADGMRTTGLNNLIFCLKGEYAQTSLADLLLQSSEENREAALKTYELENSAKGEGPRPLFTEKECEVHISKLRAKMESDGILEMRTKFVLSQTFYFMGLSERMKGDDSLILDQLQNQFQLQKSVWSQATPEPISEQEAQKALDEYRKFRDLVRRDFNSKWRNDAALAADMDDIEVELSNPNIDTKQAERVKKVAFSRGHGAFMQFLMPRLRAKQDVYTKEFETYARHFPEAFMLREGLDLNAPRGRQQLLSFLISVKTDSDFYAPYRDVKDPRKLISLMRFDALVESTTEADPSRTAIFNSLREKWSQQQTKDAIDETVVLFAAGLGCGLVAGISTPGAPFGLPLMVGLVCGLGLNGGVSAYYTWQSDIERLEMVGTVLATTEAESVLFSLSQAREAEQSFAFNLATILIGSGAGEFFKSIKMVLGGVK